MFNVCLNADSIQYIMKNKECVFRVHVFPFFTDVQPVYIVHCIKSYCELTEKFCSEMPGMKLSSYRENA
jgi:hypothetical protein